jgi:transposase
MHRSLRLSALIPPGLIVDQIHADPEQVTITVHSAHRCGVCPSCGTLSSRVHSHYLRRVADLPLAGRPVQFLIRVRRFRCDDVRCGRRIFTERFAPDVIARHARRTTRLEGLVYHLGLALGGRPATRLARRLMLPVSKDTLLRIVRRYARHPCEPLSVTGIDDWAWRRNHRYGTIVCDLERRRIASLLPDREQATAQAWLANHPEIGVIARDRGGGYGEAAAKALPDAVQVADRWHLMENASRAFLDAVRKSMRQIRQVIGSATINPDLLTCAERLQYEGYLRREETNSTVMALATEGVAIKQIVRRTGLSRGTVRQILRGCRSDVFRQRESSLEAYWPLLEALWTGGCRNGAELWRRLRASGFRGSLRVVGEWTACRRRAERIGDEQLQRVPSARTIARLMSTGRDMLSKAETVTIAAIESGVPALVSARETIAEFQSLIRNGREAGLTAWIARARRSLVASFASGIAKDEAAVRAAITLPWSNGQTEGQITKLKLVKRQMYGRGHLDLLQARLVGAE